MKEIFCGDIAAVNCPNLGSVGDARTEEVDHGRSTSVCQGLTPSGNMEASSCEVSSRERYEVYSVLREELSGSRSTSTPVKGLWPIYSKTRSSVFGRHEAPPCNSIGFEGTDKNGAPENGNLSRCCLTEVSGDVEKSDFTSGGFSTLEDIPKKRADDRDGGLYGFSSGVDKVRVPPVESIVEQEEISGGKNR